MALKPQYKKASWRPHRWCYSTQWGYGRAIDTFQHCRQYVHDLDDIRSERWAFMVRSKRNAGFMSSWNLEPPVSRCGGKSWKDYTRQKKQWS